MADFDTRTPPRAVTDPKAEHPPGYIEYPRHLHKFGEPPCVVHNDTEKEKALGEGWSLTPVLKAPSVTEDAKKKGARE